MIASYNFFISLSGVESKFKGEGLDLSEIQKSNGYENTLHKKFAIEILL